MSKKRGTDLTEKQEKILIHLVEQRKQRFGLSTAMEIYNTKNSAKSALKTLDSHGFVDRIKSGQYELKGIPPTLKEYVDLNL